MDERSVERKTGTICETVLWEMASLLEPPYKGYIMFASSCPDTNVPHLIEEGYEVEEIVIVEYGEHETIWIPKRD